LFKVSLRFALAGNCAKVWFQGSGPRFRVKVP
jgi:hypothetical protein